MADRVLVSPDRDRTSPERLRGLGLFALLVNVIIPAAKHVVGPPQADPLDLSIAPALGSVATLMP